MVHDIIKMGLFKFLKEHKVENGKDIEFTHTSMKGGKWYIADDELSEFYKLYSKEESELSITEKHQPKNGPIVIDLDFKVKKKERVITTEVIKNIVKTLTKILKKIFDEDDDYMCVVLQRPEMYEKNNLWTDGLHIQFPYLVCDYMIHFLLRNKFIEKYEQEVKCENEMKDIYDEAVILRNNWCMYKSTKANMKPYKIIKIYNDKTKKEDLTKLEWIKLLSIRNKTTVVKHTNEKYFIEHIKEYRKSQQEILEKPTKNTPLEITQDQEYDEQIIRSLLNMLSDERVNDYIGWINIGMILQHCDMTDKDDDIDYLKLWVEWSKRSIKYKKGDCEYRWKYFSKSKSSNLKIGSLFHYARQDNPLEYKKFMINDYITEKKTLIPLKKFEVKDVIENKTGTYVELKTDKYCSFVEKKHDCETMYIQASKNGAYLKCKECHYDQFPVSHSLEIPNKILNSVFGVGNTFNITINVDQKSIDSFAIHEPEYNVFDDKELNKLVYLALNCSGIQLANLMYYLCKNEFNCTNEKIWYMFKKHKWITKGSEGKFFTLISVKTTDYFLQLRTYYKNLIKEKKETEKTQLMIMVINNVIKKIEDTSFRNSIMKDMCLTFYNGNEEFEDKLDKRSYLIGFENGVYDLEKDEFRDGRSDDYITMSVGYDFVAKYSKYKKDLDYFLESIMPDKAQLSYLLKYSSTGLTNDNDEEIAVVMSGETRNGKSVYKELMNYTLGEYFCTYSSSFLTHERPSSTAPEPDLIKIIGKRMIMGSEPEAKARITNGFYKYITGGDTITCRNLYDKQIIDVKPTHKIALLCNKIPAFSDPDDPAIWARTMCLEFPITFVENPKKLNEKKIDKTLKKKVELWKQDFMLLLIENYKLYKKEGLKPTEEVLKFTKEYKDENDVYLKYVNERTEESKNHIHTNTLYEDFKKWYPTKDVPSSKTFIKGLREHLTIQKSVRVNDKISLGVKNLRIKKNPLG